MRDTNGAFVSALWNGDITLHFEARNSVVVADCVFDASEDHPIDQVLVFLFIVTFATSALNLRFMETWDTGSIADTATVVGCGCGIVREMNTVLSIGAHDSLMLIVGTIAFLQSTALFSLTDKIFSPPTFVSVARTALPQAAMYVVSIAPVFFGYAVCATASLGGVEPFSTVQSSLVTFFCTMFGDGLMDSFLVLNGSDSLMIALFSRAIYSSFLVLFVCNVLNVIICISQDSFAHVESTHRGDSCFRTSVTLEEAISFVNLTFENRD
jgi:hypothetical protein